MAQVNGEWSYGNDHGGFTAYSDQENAIIENAFASGQHNVTIQIDQGHRVASYLLDFEAMTQTNTATQFERELYRELATAAPDPTHTFSWMDDYGNYFPFDRDLCALLDMMRTRGYTQPQVYTQQMTRYIIGFQALTQQNTETGRFRSIKITPNQQQAAAAAGSVAIAPAGGGGNMASSNDTIDNVIARAKDVTSDMTDNDSCPICFCGYDQDSPAIELPSCPHVFHEGKEGPIFVASVTSLPIIISFLSGL